MRRAQIEMFGLVFIVLLIMVGFLIYISLNASPKPKGSLGADYERTQMATNFIDAALKVNTECQGRELREVLPACEFGFAGTPCTSGRSPCEEARYVLYTLIGKTLVPMQYDYLLNFSVDGVEVFSNASEGYHKCRGRVKAGVFPLTSPTYKTLLLKLDICR